MAGRLQVEVVYALPDRAWRVPLSLPEGATVAEAVEASGLAAKLPGGVVDPGQLAVYGQVAAPGDRLADGDRVEILRPLLADPKQARRRRAADAG